MSVKFIARLSLALIVLSIILYTIPYTTTPAHAQQPLQQELLKPKPWKLTNQIDSEAKQAWGMNHINPYEVIGGLERFVVDVALIYYAYVKSDGDIVAYSESTPECDYYPVVYDIEQSPIGEVYGIGIRSGAYYAYGYYHYLDLLKYSLSENKWYRIKEVEELVRRSDETAYKRLSMQVSVFNDIVVIARVKGFELKVYGLSPTTGYTIWDKSYTLSYSDISAHKAFAIARYNNTLVLALLGTSGVHEVVNVYHINVGSGNIVYNTLVTLPANSFGAVFRIRDVSGVRSTIGYIVFGGNRVYLWDPGVLEWRVYCVSKPIYYIVSGSRLGSYYVLFYGTYEDDDPDWEGYLTDLCGHDYYVYDVPSSNLPTYTGFATKFVYITSNYIVVGVPFSSDGGIATYSYTTSVSSVSIYSSVDCSVCVDGELVGNITSGSWLNFTIEHGVHNISIIGSDNYVYIVSMLEVSGDLVIIDPLKPMLAVINGTVIIESLYTVISIYINGSYVGSISPGENYTLSLEPGVYNVTHVAPGRVPAVYVITLSENETITIADPFKEVSSTTTTPTAPTTPHTTTRPTTPSITLAPSITETPRGTYVGVWIPLSIALIAIVAIVVAILFTRKRRKES